ncbi:MAG: hypothetical protein QNJ69_10920 [Gammaproteobacteria bacterium]|nr:hypothetical protein [Gammaproteobacteria bacterium]
MIEISPLMFTLVGEVLVILSIVLLLWLFFTIKRQRKDRGAARKLVDQVMHQSATRQQETNSFLHEKYRFEGDELEQAVMAIDTAEKKFIQRFINIYLQRDAEALASLDATLAELIDTYKKLSPSMPDTEAMQAMEQASAVKAEAEQQIAEIREDNERLSEELGITKQTMSNMISEFGNMFGGGADHELAKHEVMKQLSEKTQEMPPLSAESSVDSEPATPQQATDDEVAAQATEQVEQEEQPAQAPQPETTESAAEDEPAVAEHNDQATEPKPQQPSGQIVTDNDIENLLQDIELTTEK